MNRKISFSSGEFYHIYNRGNDKRKIFCDDSDYKRFIKLLFFANGICPVDFRSICKGDTFASYIEKRGETLVDIGAYCLMPNHFHLLVRAKNDGEVSLFMKKICTSYSMYFNLKNTRTGKLFEGPFMATHVDSDEYLKYMFAYIHLNPVKLVEPEWKEKGINDMSGTIDFLRRYTFSSHEDYISSREAGFILNKTVFPEYFGLTHNLNDYTGCMKDWLTIQR